MGDQEADAEAFCHYCRVRHVDLFVNKFASGWGLHVGKKVGQVYLI